MDKKTPLNINAVVNATRFKGTMTIRLKNDWLTKRSLIKMERKYYVKLPLGDIHGGDFTGEVSICKHLLMRL